MIDTEQENDIQQAIAEDNARTRALTDLFGAEIVEQARLLDVADLNMSDEMTAGIADGIRQLKQLKRNPAAQRQWLDQQSPALRLLLCLWIMDMDLLEKI